MSNFLSDTTWLEKSGGFNLKDEDAGVLLSLSFKSSSMRNFARCVGFAASRNDNKIGTGRWETCEDREELGYQKLARGRIADKGNHRQFIFSGGDKMGKASMQIARCNEAGPEDSQDVSGTAADRSVAS
jgi:hypothetical protein